MEFYGIFFHNDNIISVKKQEYLEVFFDYFWGINKAILICCPLEQAKKILSPLFYFFKRDFAIFVIFCFLFYLHSRNDNSQKFNLLFFIMLQSSLYAQYFVFFA